MLFPGFIIQLIFLVSIFDIYFKSPIINGIQPIKPSIDAPAKRLVMFLADGLRYESFAERGSVPKIKTIANTRGLWGISNTRVPTESRPGHVALIGGFYEDPSAVAKGWKENPVDFDSVFNQSRYTWCWGSPDICHIFTKVNHVFSDVYLEKEDFSGKSATLELDKWVFNKVESFLNSTSSDSQLLKKLTDDKVILALHLLGLDTAGHSHKPHSREFHLNLQYVDDQILQVEAMIEKFFNHDKKTAYIFTSDHGMTNWGSHGTGDPHETQTPIVVWGAGILNPSNTGKNTDEEIFSHRRFDINQADVATLMSTLIGVPIPGNSIGILPRNYLNMSSQDTAKAMYTNAKQMLSHYTRMREIIELNVMKFLYEPFELLTDEKIEEIYMLANRMLAKEEYVMLEILSNETIELSLKGLTYYHNYYQRYLLICISFAYAGWIICLLTYILPQKTVFNNALNFAFPNTDDISPKLIHIQQKHTVINLLFIPLMLVVVILNFVQKFSLMYHIYSVFPLMIWWNVFSSWEIWLKYFSNYVNCNGHFVAKIILYIIGIESLVATFFFRWSLSVGIIGIIIWTLISYRKKDMQIKIIMYNWCISCLILAIFVFLPIVGSDSNLVILMTSSFLIMGYNLAIFYYDTLFNFYKNRYPWKDAVISLGQISILFIAVFNIYSVSKSIEKKKGLNSINQLASWILAAAGLILPLFRSRYVLSRLTSLYSSFSVLYLLLSVSHEGMFMLVLISNLFLWTLLEYGLMDGKTSYLQLTATKFSWDNVKISEKPLSSNDFRRSYIFLLFIILSFFGTGNVASLNSFEVQWVRCFVTRFSPFIITPLILSKTMIPFLCVASSFNTINFLTKAPVKQIFLIFLVFSNFMAMHFLYFVRNTGSWLDIGTSISHYVIMHLTILFIYILHVTANFFTRVELLPTFRDVAEEKNR